MTVTGTVTKVVHRRSRCGSRYLAITLDDRMTFKFLHDFQPEPRKGQTVTIDGMAMMGFPRVNIGGATLTIQKDTNE